MGFFYRSKKSQAGMTLIEIVVSLGIMSIIIGFIAQWQVSQMKESQALSEKMATTDLEKLLISSLSDGSTCNYILNNPIPLTFDSTLVSPTAPQEITPTEPLYAKVVSGVPGPVIARVGDAASPQAKSVIVKSIKLKITEGSGTVYKANWEIDFDSRKMVRALKPVNVSTLLTVDNTTPTATRVTGCMNGASGGAGLTRIVSQTYSAWRWPAGSADCAADEYVLSGGGTCTSAIGWMWVASTYPTATGWYVSCDTQMHINASVIVYALCAKK